jgi:prephenate dehydrogenase
VTPTRVGVIGLGLIGGSIARRLSELPDKYEPIGFDVRTEPRGGLELAESVEQLAWVTELVIVAVPPEQTASVIAAVLAADQNVLVTDVASVKKPIVRQLGAHDRYLPSHPLAGAETAGWSAARPELLQGATWAVCPTYPSAPAGPLCRWAEVFDCFDARLIVCDPGDHDVTVARTSHAPHVVATAIAASLADHAYPRLAAALSGGALRDITRVANAEPAMWREILELNGDNVAAALDGLRGALDGRPAWERSREMAALVDELRWQPRAWEERTFEWPAWDELIALGHEGTAIRRPRVDQQDRLVAEVATRPA